jgi:NADP-dependent 3-hydroxy acid dehydrogenase YdfG
MKVAITGHTSGIGRALTKVFPDFRGYSRSTGYDISHAVVQDIIVQDSLDCEIFINNAACGFSQTTLLYKVWENWKTENRIIVCIGSDAADYNSTSARPYNIHKVSLEHACLQLHHSKMPCKVIHVKPSYVDTPRVAHIDTPKIESVELAEYIKTLTELKGSMWVPNITVYPVPK